MKLIKQAEFLLLQTLELNLTKIYISSWRQEFFPLLSLEPKEYKNYISFPQFLPLQTFVPKAAHDMEKVGSCSLNRIISKPSSLRSVVWSVYCLLGVIKDFLYGDAVFDHTSIIHLSRLHVITVLPFGISYFYQQKLFYFFSFDDLSHIESNNLVQKPLGAFLF